MRNDYAIHCVVGKRKVEKITQTFSTRLVGRRNALGLSQQELARRAGISLRSVQNYEGREAYPTGRTLRSLCAVLDVPIAYLMGPADDAGRFDDDPAPTVLREESLPVVGASPSGYRSRADRVITRLSELTDLEYARTEPAILSMIEAVLGARPRLVNSSAAPTVGAQATAQMRKDVADIVAARGSTPRQPAANTPATRNSVRGSTPPAATTPS